MKTLLTALLLVTAGCASNESGQNADDQKSIAQRRLRQGGVCGNAAYTQALSAHKWCATEAGPDASETLQFNSSNCSVTQTVKRQEVQHDQTGQQPQTRQVEDTFKGTWQYDEATDPSRPLQLFFESFSPMYHTVRLAANGSELILTDVKYAPCAAAVEAQPEPPVETVPETEI